MPLELYARTSQGKRYVLTLEPTSTVYDAKLAIQGQSRIAPADMSLTLDGNALEESATLQDVGVMDGATQTLHILQRGDVDWANTEDVVPVKCCVIL